MSPGITKSGKVGRYAVKNKTKQNKTKTRAICGLST